MGCACGKNRANQAAAARGVAYVWDFTPPNSPEDTVPLTFSSALEAKREVRKYGGGNIRRREVTQAAA